MPLTIERKLPLILFFVVLVLTLLGFSLYQYTGSLQNAVAIEKRVHNVVGKLDDTLRLTLDVESALNGFVITGNDTYLEPYRTAKEKIPSNLADLRSMVRDSAAEVEEVDRLDSWTTNYLSQVEKKIERRRIEGFDATITTLGDSPERSATANIRASINRLKAAELNSQQSREAHLDESFDQTIWVLIIGCVAGAVALGMANIVVGREIGKRRKAEVALTEANRDLESKIDDRTEELEKVNESLRTVAEEREVLLKNEQSARHEAEIANRLRDEFMATVSHELKTPLNSILGWARMLKAGDLDEAQIKKALGTIIKNSETQNRLIEDLLDVARIISGKLVLELEAIDPTELLRDAVEIIRPAANSKGVTISNEADRLMEPVSIRGDRNRLMQVFSNLLANAVKFTPDAGIVCIGLNFDGTELQIQIKDNGIGISPEFLPVVFERFRQDAAGTRQNGGLGLGLAIVRQLVEMHGGSVSVKSEGPGQGSEFTVTLPAQLQANSLR